MFVFQTFGANAVRTLSFGRKQQPHRYRNEVRNYQQVLVIALTSGALSVESSELRAELGRGELLLLPPQASFTLSTPHRGYQGHYVEGYPAEVSLPPVVRRFRADADLHRTLVQIELELARPFDHALLPALYSTLYIRSLRHAESLPSRHHPGPLLQHVDGILLANRYTNTPLGKLLHGLPVSQRHLSRLYLSERGVTIKQAFLGLKLAEARKLLAETTLSVSTIASELGFPSSQHFATRFRQLTGVTPSELRRKP